MAINFEDNKFDSIKINQLHDNDDVDTGRLSHHHTLGGRPNQAAPGNHEHSTFMRVGDASLDLPANGASDGLASFDSVLGSGLTWEAGTPTRLQINKAGIYHITAIIRRDGNNNGDYRVQIRKNAGGNIANGTRVAYGYENNNAAINAGYGRNASAKDWVRLIIGDYLEVWAAQTSASIVPVEVILAAEYVGP